MNRYLRQTILPEVGEAGQMRLRQSHVLVVGAGALGCPVLQYLTGAGVGQITFIDPDIVERGNLHRQPLYAESDIGQHKVVAAAHVLRGLNPDVTLHPRIGRVDPDNVDALLANVDVVLDCADSFAASYILSDACQALRRPYISASVLGLNGYVGGFCGSAPSLRAVFPQLPKSAATCATAGVLGPVAGLLGCLQAQMALAAILGLDPSPLGQMVVLDFKTYGFRTFRFDGALEPVEERIPFIAYSGLSDADFIVDLRGVEESPVPVHERAIRATVDEFRRRELTPAAGSRVVFCCRSGLRAWHAGNALSNYWDGQIAVLALGDTSAGRAA